MNKRIMKVTEINTLTGTMKGTFNTEVSVKPTETFDHCQFLEIQRL
jgi:hypothetical protein